jgi:competence protein ComEA
MTLFRNAIARSVTAILALSCLTMAANTRLEAQEKKQSTRAKTAGAEKKTVVDVNSADVKTLELLPGIGPTLAQRIVEGRPYQSLADLGKVKGMSQAKLDGIKDDIKFGSAAAAKTTSKRTKADKPSAAAGTSAPQKSTPTAAKKTLLDVNSSDVTALETLPGIGPTLAERIVEGRPYKTLADLGKVKGMSQSRLDGIKDEITFGRAPATSKQITKKTTARPAETAVESKPAPQIPSATVEPKSTEKSEATPLTPTGRTAANLAPGERININKATVEELDGLPGIGPVKAQAIIDYRNQNGPFKTIEDIENVKGIKSGEFSKISDLIKISD